MALRTIIGMMTGFIMIGIVAAALIILCYVLYFQLIRRRILHQEGQMHIGRLCIGILTVGYAGMVFAVTCLRGAGFGQMHMSAHVLQSYREAWNTGSATEWRNIIWNILMFIPIGFLLPLNGKIWRKWWATPAVCLAATVGIECIQLFGGQGIFELDDMINNFVGGLIGCGVIQIFFVVRSEKKHKIGKIVLCLAPALFVMITAGIVYGIYASQPYGNLGCNYAYRIDMKKVDVTWNANLDAAQSAPVYQTQVGTNEEALELARALYKNMGLELDESDITYYDESVYCGSKSGSYNITIEKKGMYYSYTDFSKFKDDGDIMGLIPGADEHKIRAALEELGIEVPADAAFAESEDNPGSYSFTVSMWNEGERILDGTCSCELYTDGTIKDVRNNIIAYQQVSTEQLIDGGEVRQRIEDGRFRYWDDDFHSLEITSAAMGYMMDSKGFYRPVYVLETVVDGEPGDTIQIPAGKK